MIHQFIANFSKSLFKSWMSDTSIELNFEKSTRYLNMNFTMIVCTSLFVLKINRHRCFLSRLHTSQMIHFNHAIFHKPPLSLSSTSRLRNHINVWQKIRFFWFLPLSYKWRFSFAEANFKTKYFPLPKLSMLRKRLETLIYFYC